MGGRIKLCREKLRNLITSLNIPKDNQIKRVELVRICSTHVKTKAANTGFREGNRNKEATWKTKT